MRFGKAEWSSWERGVEREWLLTNGIGGFSSASITGANTRRYHGLLVASLEPPVKRHLILSQLHETLSAGERTYDLHSFSTGDFVMRGYMNLQSFELEPLPVYTYCTGDAVIEKTVTMVYGKNTVAVVYHVISGSEDITLKITPLVNFRDYHGNSDRARMSFSQTQGGDNTKIVPYETDTVISLSCCGSCYVPLENCWFGNMFYPLEQERGLHAYEDHYIPGSFVISLKSGCEGSFTFICTVEKEIGQTDGSLLIADERARLASLIDAARQNGKAGRFVKAGSGVKAEQHEETACPDEFFNRLVLAADQFIAYRKSTGAVTILAGYPWFTDWGRDAMISLCGLTLCTGRFGDAAGILSTFGSYVKFGLLPNMFPDVGGEPGYNTVDAALWYFEAVNKYVEYTGDISLIRDVLLDSMLQIFDGYRKGTLHDIGMGDDALISAGNQATQLTWMDAKAGDVVFTPRHGKAVEINALWYNALRVLEELLGKINMDEGNIPAYSEKYCVDPMQLRALSDMARESFIDTFWFEEGKYLYDVVNGDYKDDRVRPNQIFAVSLSYPVLEGARACCVVEKVWKDLYTAYGLRSLSQDSPGYIGRYDGDRWSRDAAYHQGTVWAWPIGHFITAFDRTLGREKQNGGMAEMFLRSFYDHMRHACLGSISEIFDGDEPLTPRGCCAQAWSVAEVLRAYVETIWRH